MAELLQVSDLVTNFYSKTGVYHAVRGVSFRLARNKVLGLVGESGCGKTVTSLSLLRLVPSPPGRIESGQVILDGRDLSGLKEEEWRKVRGKSIAMIFQDPMTSLDPVFPIGRQLEETIASHARTTRKERLEAIEESLNLVKIPSPQRVLHEYPHQLSGGMRQRVMIAMALSCRPQLLIADEPTTALDVTIQAQIIDLLRSLIDSSSMSVILITHNLGLVADIADEVAVMYAGQIVEYGTLKELFSEPLHPYTAGLMKAVPRIRNTQKRLDTIEGSVPDLREPPRLCSFLPRCALSLEVCRREPIELRLSVQGQRVRCHRVPGDC